MSNCYLQFSEVLPYLTKNEEVWLKEQLENSSGFGYEFDTDKTWRRFLWIYAEEFGEIEQVALLMQKFLCQFRNNEYFTLTYSISHSKMQIGGFSGGGVFITATSIEYHVVDNFITKKVEDYESN